jgi:hypothetical protein
VVECDLAKVEVAGSNPVSRSIRSPAPSPRPEGVLLHGGCVTDAVDILRIWRYFNFRGAVPKW